MEEIRKEPVTAALLLINILAFLFVEFTGFSQDTIHMLDCGAAYAPLILRDREFYRLFTSMFLHFGIEHLINNMLVLFVLGSRLERVTGSIRFLVIYIVGGFLGNLVSLAADFGKTSPAVSAGASGAVFAVMGAMIYKVIRNKGHLADLSTKQILAMSVLSLYFGFTSSGVDNAAHLGGLVAGFLLAILVGQPRRQGNVYERRSF